MGLHGSISVLTGGQYNRFVPVKRQVLRNLVSIWSMRPEVLRVLNIRGMNTIVDIMVETGVPMTPVAFTVATMEDLTQVAGIIEFGFLRNYARR